jgi:uncharacterized protein
MSDETTPDAIMLEECRACGSLWRLPRGFCPACGSSDIAERAAGGAGTVYALTEIRRAPSPDFKAEIPYTIALVDLDEGARVMGRAADGLEIGDRVRARIARVGEAPMPLFEPEQ